MKGLFFAALLTAIPAFGQPTISSVDPASGPSSGGAFVHIVGTDLLGLPLACPARSCGNYVDFGDAFGTISINTATEIVAETPPHAAGTVDVIVNIAGKATITLPAAFRYESPGSTASEQLLLPIVLDGFLVPGAYGSSWKGDLTFHNASSEDIPIGAPNCNPILLAPCPPSLHLPPQSTVIPSLYAQPGGGPGVFIYIPRPNIRDVDIALRVQDISRQALTWGTAIPVVRSVEFHTIARLIGVPTDSRFRTTLRVYGYGGTADPITVRIFDPASSQPLVDTPWQLQGTSNGQTYPAYLQIDGLADVFPQIRGHDVIRVEVESASNPARLLWAFISVTNNETQHVTVIAPSPTASP